jgi:anhydro-N-acetylmuramic acid kinase
MGGQGGPLVPIGDMLFFGDYKMCLNIGGIANISCKIPDGKIIAYDVVPANLVLNELALKLKVPFDKDGEIARSGTLNEELLNALNDNWYYKKEYPKTIGGGFVSKVVIPTLYRFRLPWQDKLRTVVEHIALQLSKDLMVINNKSNAGLSVNDKMLVTGGGAYNTFLIERIKQFSPVQIMVPDEDTVKFKEALIIGLLGVLRIRNEVNVLSVVTGAAADNIGGEIYTYPGKPIKA